MSELIAHPRRGRRVAIVGSSETRDKAPWADTSWELWTMNDMTAVCSRVDRLFILHNPQYIINHGCKGDAWAVEEEKFMRENDTVPIYMHEPPDWAPRAEQYPTEVILKDFGRYFTNSVSWMIALAIHEGVDEIGLWGVDMAHETEYGSQRPSCEYFLGIAVGKGIAVYIPPESSLLRCRKLYGLEDDFFVLDVENRRAGLQLELDRQRANKMNAIVNEARLDGALEFSNNILGWWKD